MAAIPRHLKKLDWYEPHLNYLVEEQDYNVVVIPHDFLIDEDEATQFSPYDIDGQNLSKAFIPYSDLSSCTAVGANFSDATLCSSYCNCSEFSNANFSNANLDEVDFDNSSADDANFTHAILSNTSFYGSTCKGANFSNANLIDVVFDSSEGNNAKFNNADLSRASFYNAAFENADFSGAILRGANFGSGNFRYANFSGADLTDADYENADFTGANFAGATLPDNFSQFLNDDDEFDDDDDDNHSNVKNKKNPQENMMSNEKKSTGALAVDGLEMGIASAGIEEFAKRLLKASGQDPESQIALQGAKLSAVLILKHFVVPAMGDNLPKKDFIERRLDIAWTGVCATASFAASKEIMTLAAPVLSMLSSETMDLVKMLAAPVPDMEVLNSTTKEKEKARR